jgi:hypothetical protein
MGIGTEITLFFGGAGAMLGLAIAADRVKARRKRWRRLLAMEARMSSAWETAKIRMLWSAPGFLAARRGEPESGRGTKYRNLESGRISGSTTANFSRYIGG